MSARSEILARLRENRLKEGDPFGQLPEARLAVPDATLGAAIAGRIAEPLAYFKSRVEAAKGNVHEIAALDQVPEIASRLLAETGREPELAVDPTLAELDWREAGLSLLEDSDQWIRDPLTTVTRAVCGVAETGTIVCASSADHDPRLNFLAHRHFAVLREKEIFATYEAAWAELRRSARWPRAVHFITGPSKTADIEQTIEYGAHGPAKLHVILVKS